MSLSRFVEEKIQKAIDEGEFENLEGKGKPLDLNAYFNLPQEFRVGYSLLKSNKFVPEEVELLKEISKLKDEIKHCANDDVKQTLTKTLNEKTLYFSILMERNKRKK